MNTNVSSSSSSPQRRRPRANGTFRLATHVLGSKTETPETESHAAKTDDVLSNDGDSKALTHTPLRSAPYYMRCTVSAPACDHSSSNNNDGGDSDDDDDVVFYKRDDYDVDTENNREFDGCSASDDDWCAALCSSDRLLLQSITGAEQAVPSLRSVHSERRKRASYESVVESRRVSTCCELMVQYEMFDSVTKSQQQQQSSQRVLSRFARRRVSTPHQVQPLQSLPPLITAVRSIFSRSHQHGDTDDDDDDLVNIRSPVAQRVVASSSKSLLGARSTLEQQQQHEQEPHEREPHEHQQHSLAHDEAERRGWTSEQLCQYNEMLGFLQQACATRSTEISVPGTRLAQMEQLLRSLQPPAQASV